MSIEAIKNTVNITELANRLGLKESKSRGMFQSPEHDDKNASLQIGGKRFPNGWTDYSTGEKGDCIDLVKYVLKVDTPAALNWLREEYGIKPERFSFSLKEKTQIEYIADKCIKSDLSPAREYLIGRGIVSAVIESAIKARSVGCNYWTSPKTPSGEPGYGGLAVAFIVREYNSQAIVAVDLRYIEPALNGGVKTQTQGEKSGHPWCMDWRGFKSAHTIVVVESAMNALSVESCGLAGWSALAVRGCANVDSIDWRILRGKRVILGFDNDPPDERGRMPGPQAAWRTHELLTGLGIACQFLDQSSWGNANDLNDLLQSGELRERLKKFDFWAIPGVIGTETKRKQRIFLPRHDFAVYWRFRCKPDFTSYVAKFETDDDGEKIEDVVDLCGFRIASISRLTVASAASTMNGEPDHSPRELYSVSVQTAYHGATLERSVLRYAELNNLDAWKKLGPVWRGAEFLRLVTIWGRATHIGARNVANFVGLCWKEGRLVVNEGHDAYFEEPNKQCPYHNLNFPSGSVSDARKVISAYAETFSARSALLLLVWALGAHIKALVGFYPHCIFQAKKGSGKSTLTEKLSSTIAMTMFSGQSVNTEYRLLTSISGTSQPVGIEEISAREQKQIDKAVSMLQEAYTYKATWRGSEMTEYLLSAPVLLIGEDVPVRSLLGKTVQIKLGEKGKLIQPGLPPFPVRQWLEFLSKLDRINTIDYLEGCLDLCRRNCRANDSGAERMIKNYAAVMLAWKLMCEFSGIQENEYNLETVIIRQMNDQIAETVAAREPWVWIIETIINEIEAGKYPYPWKYDIDDNGNNVLYIRITNVMHHLATNSGLKGIYDGLSVKSPTVLKQQLKDAGVLLDDRVNPTINGEKAWRISALGVDKMAEYGLSVGG